MDKKPEMPLVRALRRYEKKRSTRFHMPGHKGRGGFKDLGRLFKKNLFRWDVTELPGLDNLHEPTGVIREAEEKLAMLYGAERSFFLVNGSTSGVLAMMGAALKPGDRVIVPRASHRSVLSGMILTGAKPVYVMPGWHEELGVYTQIIPGVLQKVIKENPDARAIVVANPTYQGFCPDLKEICEIARQNNMLVLADEAHGPHLAFSPHLPATAGDFEVDAWVQSPHKMLSSLTQSAWLHIKGDRIDKERLSSYLGMVTSTSPSYILMASLDWARMLMESCGRYIAEKALNMAEKARKIINGCTGFYCAGEELKGKEGILDIDLSRLMVNVSVAGFTGFEVEYLLRLKYNIYAEYADLCNVYFLITSWNNDRDIRKLTDALKDISKHGLNKDNGSRNAVQKHASIRNMLADLSAVFKNIPKKAIEPREAFDSGGEWVDLRHAAGRIAKKALVPYPPGIPLIMPGEILENEHIVLTESLIRAGCSIQGTDSNNRVYVTV